MFPAFWVIGPQGSLYFGSQKKYGFILQSQAGEVWGHLNNTQSLSVMYYLFKQLNLSANIMCP